MDYETFRHFADSWGLVFLFAAFVAAVAFVLRPGAKKHYDEAARIPLKED
jgi:cytochrome c oxidase cbb3-type subunit 4